MSNIIDKNSDKEVFLSEIWEPEFSQFFAGNASKSFVYTGFSVGDGQESVTITTMGSTSKVKGIAATISNSDLTEVGSVNMFLRGISAATVYGGGMAVDAKGKVAKEYVVNGNLVNTAAAVVNGNTTITLQGGTFGKVYGGGAGYGAVSEGNIFINYEGGKVTTIYGGGETGAIVVGDVTIAMGQSGRLFDGKNSVGKVFGGGKDALVTGNVTIVVNGSMSGTKIGTIDGKAEGKNGYVLGSSELIFNDYKGQFTGTIKNFENITIQGGSQLEMKKQDKSLVATSYNFLLDDSAVGMQKAMLTMSAKATFSNITVTIDAASSFLDSAAGISTFTLITGKNLEGVNANSIVLKLQEFDDEGNVIKENQIGNYAYTVDVVDQLNAKGKVTGQSLVVTYKGRDMVFDSAEQKKIVLSDAAEDVFIKKGAELVGGFDAKGGDDIISIQQGAIIDGSVSTGEGDDELYIEKGASINGYIDLGKGDNTMVAAQGVEIANAIKLADDSNNLIISNGGSINSAFIGGNSETNVGITLNGGKKIIPAVYDDNGNLITPHIEEDAAGFGFFDDNGRFIATNFDTSYSRVNFSLSVNENASVGSIRLGFGNDVVTIREGANVGAAIDFGQGGNDTLVLYDTLDTTNVNAIMSDSFTVVVADDITANFAAFNMQSDKTTAVLANGVNVEITGGWSFANNAVMGQNAVVHSIDGEEKFYLQNYTGTFEAGNSTVEILENLDSEVVGQYDHYATITNAGVNGSISAYGDVIINDGVTVNGYIFSEQTGDSVDVIFRGVSGGELSFRNATITLTANAQATIKSIDYLSADDFNPTENPDYVADLGAVTFGENSKLFTTEVKEFAKGVAVGYVTESMNFDKDILVAVVNNGGAQFTGDLHFVNNGVMFVNAPVIKSNIYITGDKNRFFVGKGNAMTFNLNKIIKESDDAKIALQLDKKATVKFTGVLPTEEVEGLISDVTFDDGSRMIVNDTVVTQNNLDVIDNEFMDGNSKLYVHKGEIAGIDFSDDAAAREATLVDSTVKGDILFSAGDDILTLNGSTQYGNINMGDGNDELNINNSEHNNSVINGVVTLGAGENIINVTGESEVNSIVLNGSEDLVNINGKLTVGELNTADSSEVIINVEGEGSVLAMAQANDVEDGELAIAEANDVEDNYLVLSAANSAIAFSDNGSISGVNGLVMAKAGATEDTIARIGNSGFGVEDASISLDGILSVSNNAEVEIANGGISTDGGIVLLGDNAKVEINGGSIVGGLYAGNSSETNIDIDELPNTISDTNAIIGMVGDYNSVELTSEVDKIQVYGEANIFAGVYGKSLDADGDVTSYTVLGTETHNIGGSDEVQFIDGAVEVAKQTVKIDEILVDGSASSFSNIYLGTKVELSAQGEITLNGINVNVDKIDLNANTNTLNATAEITTVANSVANVNGGITIAAGNVSMTGESNTASFGINFNEVTDAVISEEAGITKGVSVGSITMNAGVSEADDSNTLNIFDDVEFGGDNFSGDVSLQGYTNTINIDTTREGVVYNNFTMLGATNSLIMSGNVKLTTLTVGGINSASSAVVILENAKNSVSLTNGASVGQIIGGKGAGMDLGVDGVTGNVTIANGASNIIIGGTWSASHTEVAGTTDAEAGNITLGQEGKEAGGEYAQQVVVRANIDGEDSSKGYKTKAGSISLYSNMSNTISVKNAVLIESGDLTGDSKVYTATTGAILMDADDSDTAVVDGANELTLGAEGKAFGATVDAIDMKAGNTNKMSIYAGFEYNLAGRDLDMAAVVNGYVTMSAKDNTIDVKSGNVSINGNVTMDNKNGDGELRAATGTGNTITVEKQGFLQIAGEVSMGSDANNPASYFEFTDQEENLEQYAKEARRYGDAIAGAQLRSAKATFEVHGKAVVDEDIIQAAESNTVRLSGAILGNYDSYDDSDKYKMPYMQAADIYQTGNSNLVSVDNFNNIAKSSDAYANWKRFNAQNIRQVSGADDGNRVAIDGGLKVRNVDAEGNPVDGYEFNKVEKSTVASIYQIAGNAPTNVVDLTLTDVKNGENGNISQEVEMDKTGYLDPANTVTVSGAKVAGYLDPVSGKWKKAQGFLSEVTGSITQTAVAETGSGINDGDNSVSLTNASVNGGISQIANKGDNAINVAGFKDDGVDAGTTWREGNYEFVEVGAISQTTAGNANAITANTANINGDIKQESEGANSLTVSGVAQAPNNFDTDKYSEAMVKFAEVKGAVTQESGANSATFTQANLTGAIEQTAAATGDNSVAISGISWDAQHTTHVTDQPDEILVNSEIKLATAGNIKQTAENGNNTIDASLAKVGDVTMQTAGNNTFTVSGDFKPALTTAQDETNTVFAINHDNVEYGKAGVIKMEGVDNSLSATYANLGDVTMTANVEASGNNAFALKGDVSAFVANQPGTAAEVTAGTINMDGVNNTIGALDVATVAGITMNANGGDNSFAAATAIGGKAIQGQVISATETIETEVYATDLGAFAATANGGNNDFTNGANGVKFIKASGGMTLTATDTVTGTKGINSFAFDNGFIKADGITLEKLDFEGDITFAGDNGAEVEKVNKANNLTVNNAVIGDVTSTQEAVAAISFDGAVDTVTFTNVEAGNIDLGDGADSLTATDSKLGNISNVETVDLTDTTAGDIKGISGAAALTVANNGDEMLTIGNITGTAGDEVVNMAGVSTLDIDLGEGADNLSISANANAVKSSVGNISNAEAVNLNSTSALNISGVNWLAVVNGELLTVGEIKGTEGNDTIEYLTLAQTEAIDLLDGSDSLTATGSVIASITNVETVTLTDTSVTGDIKGISGAAALSVINAAPAPAAELLTIGKVEGSITDDTITALTYVKTGAIDLGDGVDSLTATNSEIASIANVETVTLTDTTVTNGFSATSITLNAGSTVGDITASTINANGATIGAITGTAGADTFTFTGNVKVASITNVETVTMVTNGSLEITGNVTGAVAFTANELALLGGAAGTVADDINLTAVTDVAIAGVFSNTQFNNDASATIGLVGLDGVEIDNTVINFAVDRLYLTEENIVNGSYEVVKGAGGLCDDGNIEIWIDGVSAGDLAVTAGIANATIGGKSYAFDSATNNDSWTLTIA